MMPAVIDPATSTATASNAETRQDHEHAATLRAEVGCTYFIQVSSADRWSR